MEGLRGDADGGADGLRFAAGSQTLGKKPIWTRRLKPGVPELGYQDGGISTAVTLPHHFHRLDPELAPERQS